MSGREIFAFDKFDFVNEKEKCSTDSKVVTPTSKDLVIREIIAVENRDKTNTHPCHYFLRFDGTNVIARFKLEKKDQKITGVEDMIYLQVK